MPRRRKSKHTFEPYEKSPNGANAFVRLCFEMLDSPAFHDLTASQKALYLYCLRESHGSATRDDANHDVALFYMNHALRTKVHGLYSAGDTRGFDRDMAALIEHGFVDCVKSGYKSRDKNIYRLSSRWLHWNTKAFSLPNNVMTTNMLRKRAQEARVSQTKSTCPGAVCKPEWEQYV